MTDIILSNKRKEEGAESEWTNKKNAIAALAAALPAVTANHHNITTIYSDIEYHINIRIYSDIKQLKKSAKSTMTQHNSIEMDVYDADEGNWTIKFRRLKLGYAI